MTYKLLTLSAAAVIAGIATLTPGSIDAYRGDPGTTGPNYTPERHEQMEQAFETNDYNLWKELMGDRGRVTEVVTEENFEQFSKAHELSEEGNVEEASKIREELGLSNHQGSGRGMGRNCDR